jgi:hypothetical protein
MRRLLRLGAPLTDLSPVAKMRDVYPLGTRRIEYTTTLLLKDATAEAVPWLPLSLCFNAIRLETITREMHIFVLRIRRWTSPDAIVSRQRHFQRTREQIEKCD